MLAPFIVCAALSISADVAPPPPPSIAVLDFKPARPEDAALAKLASSAFVQSLAKRSRGRVLGEEELKGILDATARARLAGCEDDERCTADLAKVITTDQIAVGRVGVVGGRALAFVSLVDTKTAVVLSRASADLKLDAKVVRAAMDSLAPQMPERVDVLALALLDPSAAKSGDERLGELRMAVLFDELDEEGKPSLQRPVEACVQKQLLDAGATLVSTAVLQKLKGQAAPRDLLRGVIPEALSADEVDVVLAGVVENKPAGEYMSARKVESSLSLSLAKIDTGDLLSSESLSAQGLDHTNAVAARKAAEKVCALVAPKITDALERRVARGERVVLEVTGALTPEIASALAKDLEKLKRVGKARVKRTTKDRATLDVTLAGGDGVTLALDLPASLGLDVKEASAGTVKAALTGGTK